uniref:Nuclear factor related to kappa-B-binding protein-like n=1 Tax=Saccoglossus kowalevskii TaxID=10224 RepID=A0ABM0GNA2_SACKO|nr:PREDICTED: nuclear factor related to kappa-B-binding protein-like [Saccoglossus kowalevskii]
METVYTTVEREKEKEKRENSTPEKKEITDIPSPRMRTDYVVKPSLDEQKKIIREQETRRYEQPHKAFTFCFNGYESVVGPVKGVFGKETTMNKAREHFLLVSDRPPYVTILSVVRDSVARLPNGEGTRADICELLKDSQFIAESATDSQINTVVSGALDRLHYEKDPCVKYDTHRKLWIYLHRSRMEGEFERIHQEQAEAEKAKKAMQKPKLSAKVKTPVKDITGKSPPLARPSSSLSETSNDSLVSSNLSFEPQSPNKSPADATSTSPKGFAKVLMGGKSVITSTNPRIHPPASVLSPRVSTPSTPGASPGGMAKGMPTLLTFGVKDVTQTQNMVAASGKSPKGGIAGSFPVAISGVTVHSTTASAIPGTVVLKNTSRAATIPGQVATLTTSATTSVASSNVNPILVPGSVIQQSHPNVSVPAAVTVTTIQHAMAPTGKILSHIGGKPLKGHATQAGLRPTVVQSLGGKPFYVQAAGVGKQSRPTLHPLRMPALGKIQPGALGPLGIRLTAQGFEAIPTQHAQGATISPGLMTVSGDSGLRISQTQPMLGGKPVSLVLGTQSSSIPVSTITSQTARQSIAPTSFSATQSTTAVTTASIAFTSTQQTVLPATAGLKFALAQASQANKGLPKGAELKASTEQQKPVGISVITTAGTTDPKKSPGVGMPMSVLLSGSPHSRQSAITKSEFP